MCMWMSPGPHGPPMENGEDRPPGMQVCVRARVCVSAGGGFSSYGSTVCYLATNAVAALPASKKLTH